MPGFFNVGVWANNSIDRIARDRRYVRFTFFISLRAKIKINYYIDC